jgi:hypothetical protein
MGISMHLEATAIALGAITTVVIIVQAARGGLATRRIRRDEAELKLMISEYSPIHLQVLEAERRGAASAPPGR